jgi:hypothetical protein
MYGARKDDQYGAPPMDVSKDGQAGALAAVHAWEPTMVVAAKVPVAPVTVHAGVPTVAAAPVEGPAGALAPAVERGGPARVWRHAAEKGRSAGGWWRAVD